MHRFGIQPLTSRLVAAGLALASVALLCAVSGPASAAPAAKAPALAGTWAVDPMHTKVTFSIKHLGLSDVTGSFSDVSGTLVADPAHLEKSSVNFTIQVKSVDTGVAMRDADLRKKDYFDADAYPTITFVSEKIMKRGKAGYAALGKLTIHGVSKPITLPFTIAGPIMDPWGSPRIGVTTATTIDRFDYGVGQAGALPVGRTVNISIELEATQPKKG